MSVTVAELIEGLKTLDPDLLVVLSSDGEGNTYKPMDEAMAIGKYYDDGPNEGTFVGQGEEDEDEDYDQDSDEVPDIDYNAQDAVVIYPEG